MVTHFLWNKYLYNFIPTLELKNIFYTKHLSSCQMDRWWYAKYFIFISNGKMPMPIVKTANKLLIIWDSELFARCCQDSIMCLLWSKSGTWMWLTTEKGWLVTFLWISNSSESLKKSCFPASSTVMWNLIPIMNLLFYNISIIFVEFASLPEHWLMPLLVSEVLLGNRNLQWECVISSLIWLHLEAIMSLLSRHW